MHASARYRNVARTVIVALAAADLSGAVLVHADDATFDSSIVETFVRVRVDAYTSEVAHRLGSDPAELARCQVVAECYARNGEGRGVVSVDRVDGLAESIADILRWRSLPLGDYVTDPTGATLVVDYVVRFIDPPTVIAPPGLDGWSRRILTASARFTIRHTG